MYADVRDYIKSCLQCQYRDARRLEEALYPIWINGMWKKFGVDVVYMSSCAGKIFLVTVRCDFSGWVEERVLINVISELVVKFLWEDIICRYGCFERLVIDGGFENKDVSEAFA